MFAVYVARTKNEVTCILCRKNRYMYPQAQVQLAGMLEKLCKHIPWQRMALIILLLY